MRTDVKWEMQLSEDFIPDIFRPSVEGGRGAPGCLSGSLSRRASGVFGKMISGRKIADEDNIVRCAFDDPWVLPGKRGR